MIGICAKALSKREIGLSFLYNFLLLNYYWEGIKVVKTTGIKYPF
jgi:hypothetical protein